MSKVKLTPDDVIFTLKNSNVPTIISEGKGDAIVLRRIEDLFAGVGLSVLAAGGRETVLKVFERRDELPLNNLFLFFVDQDCWIYSGRPLVYNDNNLFYTDGYSIENDMFRDGELLCFLTADERYQFNADLSRFLDWYAVALDRHLIDQTSPLATSSHFVLDAARSVEDFLNLTEGETYPGTQRDHLAVHYDKEMRGKSLFSLLNRQFNHVDRPVKLGTYVLLEIGSARSGFFMNRIINWVVARLRGYGYAV